MDLSMLNLIIRVILLQLLAITINISFSKRDFATGFFVFGVWTTIFRLTLARAVALYIGVFGKNSEVLFSGELLTFMTGPQAANVTTVLILIGTIFLLSKIVNQKEVTT